MPRHIAFLRGINLGNRRVKMERLREIFEGLGFTEVATFIASGNVLFDAKPAAAPALERRISAGLEAALGYKVDVFLRQPADITAILTGHPFAAELPLAPPATVQVAFLHEPLSAEHADLLRSCATEVDAFATEGREFYWLCRVRITESPAWANKAMKPVQRVPSTIRNLSSLRKLAEAHGFGV